MKCEIPDEDLWVYLTKTYPNIQDMDILMNCLEEKIEEWYYEYGVPEFGLAADGDPVISWFSIYNMEWVNDRNRLIDMGDHKWSEELRRRWKKWVQAHRHWYKTQEDFDKAVRYYTQERMVTK